MDEAALDEVYLGGFDEFVTRRNELAKRLKDEGDAEAANRVRALKKPNRVAWALNRLGAGEPKLRHELLEAGEELRAAQAKVVGGKAKGTALRAVADRERAAVEAALEALAGTELGAAALERARQTLHSVALDDDVRRDFEAHRLVTDHEAVGLGDPSAMAAAPKAEDSRAAKKRRDELKAAEAQANRLERRLKQAERDAEAAEQAAEKARRDLERAARELEDARGEAEAARRRADELRESG